MMMMYATSSVSCISISNSRRRRRSSSSYDSSSINNTISIVGKRLTLLNHHHHHHHHHHHGAAAGGGGVSIWWPNTKTTNTNITNNNSNSGNSISRGGRVVVVASSTYNYNNKHEDENEDEDNDPKPITTPIPTSSSSSTTTGGPIQLYQDIERLLLTTVKQSQGVSSSHWTQVEGAWVLKPQNSKPVSVVHFVGGIFVGAAPQLTYRLFLERLAHKGVLVIATPFSSGFDHFFIADEVQFKFDRCMRFLQEPIQDLPTFGIGHSLGALIHLLIGSRYAVERKGNVLMAFNNKDASVAIPIFSPILVPMAQNLGPFLSQIISSPTLRMGAEMTKKQLENLSPEIMKQVLPLVEQLPPLYMDLANGRENFTPKPEETRRIIKSYYGVSKNLLVKFKDDTIDETSALAHVLSDSAISSMLDMSIRSLPGDHGLPLQQALPDVPPAMAEAVNRGSEFLANLTVGTPWENVAKDMSNTLGVDSKIFRPEISKDVNVLVDVITSWMASNEGPKLLNS